MVYVPAKPFCPSNYFRFGGVGRISDAAELLYAERNRLESASGGASGGQYIHDHNPATASRLPMTSQDAYTIAQWLVAILAAGFFLMWRGLRTIPTNDSLLDLPRYVRGVCHRLCTS